MESQGMFRPDSSWQTHHLIPQAVWKENKAFLDSIGMKGKGLGRDSWSNGLYMPSSEADARGALREFFHRGPHEKYSKEVGDELEKIRKDFRKRYYVAVAQRFNRLKTLKSLLKF